jgi:hypothetical protein
MSGYIRRHNDTMTEAGNLQAAADARANAETARSNGDHDYARHCESYAKEADIQAEMSRRQSR